MKYSQFDKDLYKQLYDLFQDGEDHVVFYSSTYAGDFDALRKSCGRLQSGDILIILYDSSDEIEVELDYNACYTFLEL